MTERATGAGSGLWGLKIPYKGSWKRRCPGYWMSRWRFPVADERMPGSMPGDRWRIFIARMVCPVRKFLVSFGVIYRRILAYIPAERYPRGFTLD